MKNQYLILIRAEEWLQRFAIVFFGFILTGIVSLNNAYLIILALFSYIGVASFGFIVNDYFDRETDKKRKNNRNPISKNLISKKSAISLAFLFAIFGLSISYFFIPQVFLLFLLLFLVLTVYSTPPFRFKEKFGLDIIANACAMPIFFLIGYMLLKELTLPILLITLGLFLLDMLTGFMQEIRDYNGDKKAGLSTTVVKLGVENSVLLSKFILIFSLGIFVFTVYNYFPIYFLLVLISLLPVIKFAFSKNMKPGVSSKVLTSVNNKSHLLLILSVIVVILLSIII